MVRPRGRFRARGVEVARDGQRPANAPPRARNAAHAAPKRAHARARGPSPRARRCASAAARVPRLPVLDQRQRDVLGLALVGARRVHGVRPLRRLGRRARRARPRRRARLGCSGARACSRRSRSSPAGARCCSAPVLPRGAPAARRRAACLFAARHARARRRDPRPRLRPGARQAAGPPRTCRPRRGRRARRSTSSPTRWSRASASTSSSSSCCSRRVLLLTGASLGGALRATGTAAGHDAHDARRARHAARTPATPARARAAPADPPDGLGRPSAPRDELIVRATPRRAEAPTREHEPERGRRTSAEPDEPEPAAERAGRASGCGARGGA